MTKKNQESNRSCRENGRESAMSTAFITCHFCKKTGPKVRDCKKLERDCEMKKSGNHERKSGVVTIKQAVIRTSSVTSRWESRKI